ncbi:type II toxin-antitoxin system prevent-host-death family antitoxin [Streptomyces sp. NPDC096033]|uniref:type II toxin-antitoxin system prevent-host-death family antitoxin n=1 Tax=Streptomyces sp. NPDC096033 TaxID=3366071 RepID=UPI00381F8A9F
MESLALEAARRGLAGVLDRTQLENTPVQITRRGKAAVVLLPPGRYAAAVAALGEETELEDGPDTVDGLRAELAAILRRVQFEGAQVRLHRHGAPAAVVVSVAWFEQAEPPATA